MSGQKLKEDADQLRSPGGKTFIRLSRRRSKPRPQHVNVQYRAYHIPNKGMDPAVCLANTCANCKYAICSFNRVFCAKMREPVNIIVDCRHFELEPSSYRLFIRT